MAEERSRDAGVWGAFRLELNRSIRSGFRGWGPGSLEPGSDTRNAHHVGARPSYTGTRFLHPKMGKKAFALPAPEKCTYTD